MSGWKTVALEEVAAIERSAIQPEAISQGTAYLGLEHIESGGAILGAKPVDAGELASSKFHFTPHHLLYGKLRPYLAKIALPDFTGICSTDILPILPGPALDRRFLCYFLRQPSMVEYANSRASGANLPRLGPSVLAEFEIPLPPLAEQRRIAEVLDRAEALRAKRRAALAQLDALNQSLFLDLFGDPATNPKNWPLARMGELFSVKHGFAFESEHFTHSGNFVLLTPGNFFETGGYRERGVKQKYYNGPVPAGYILPERALLVAMTEQAPGLLGSPIFIPEPNRFLHNQRLGLIEVHKAVDPTFVFFTFNSPFIRDQIQASSTGTKVKHTSPTKIASIVIPVPPLDIQREFARRVAAVERLKASQRAALAELDALFAALQHRAFRGEL